jgi:hypothetical protein
VWKDEGSAQLSIEADLEPAVYFLKAQHLNTPPAGVKAYTISVSSRPAAEPP